MHPHDAVMQAGRWGGRQGERWGLGCAGQQAWWGAALRRVRQQPQHRLHGTHPYLPLLHHPPQPPQAILLDIILIFPGLLESIFRPPMGGPGLQVWGCCCHLCGGAGCLAGGGSGVGTGRHNVNDLLTDLPLPLCPAPSPPLLLLLSSYSKGLHHGERLLVGWLTGWWGWLAGGRWGVHLWCTAGGGTLSPLSLISAHTLQAPLAPYSLAHPPTHSPLPSAALQHHLPLPLRLRGLRSGLLPHRPDRPPAAGG